MRKFKSLASGRGFRSSFRAADFVRPGGEAILLVGVALGCVQLGWGAIFPETGGPTAASTTADEGQASQSRPLRSPFAPMQSSAVDAASIRATALAGVKVVGVRAADIAENSGAILAFPDGRQRPFLVGHEITDGIILNRVEPGRIVVSFEGGEQVLPVDGASSEGSFALLLMGRSPSSSYVAVAAPPTLANSSPAQSATAIQIVSATDAQWLAATMAQVEMRNGQPYAWRMASSPPKAVADAGLHAGDLILTVNGNSPSAPSAMLAAASSREIQIAVEGPSGERKVVTLPNGMPS